MIFIIVITNNNIPRGRFARMRAVDGKQGTVSTNDGLMYSYGGFYEEFIVYWGRIF